MERLANALLVVSVRCIAICAFEGGSHTLLKSRYKFAFGSRQEIRYFLRDLFDLYKFSIFVKFTTKEGLLPLLLLHRLFVKFTRNTIGCIVNRIILLINMTAIFSAIIDTFNMPALYYSYKKKNHLRFMKYLDQSERVFLYFIARHVIGY